MLKKLNQYDNTIIFFTSDNGGHFLVGANNSPLRGCKTSAFQGIKLYKNI
jgi:arylsulfatase A-like enzyme